MSKDDGTKEYFEKLKIVEKFCSGDTERAKQILKGEFNDIIIFKCRFKDDEDFYFGLFCIFVSTISKHVIGSYSLISSNASVYNYKPYDDWRGFLGRIEKELGEAELEKNKTETLQKVLTRLDELKLFKKLFGWVKENDIKTLTVAFQRIINKVLNVEKTEVVVDFEHSTSLVLFEELGLKPVK